MLTFTPTQTKVLNALAQYKFLTTSQMVRLGVSSGRSNLGPHLMKLKSGKRPFIGEMKFGFHPKKGRLESFYYLKSRTVSILIEGLGLEKTSIHLPKGESTLFNSDYFHRKNTLDCQIALELMAKKNGWEVLVAERYFDQIGSNRRNGSSKAKTRIDLDGDTYLIADGVFKIQMKEQTELYCLEMYNGKDTKRCHQQLRQYIQALVSGSPSIKYHHKNTDGTKYRGFRVLSVFEFPEIRKAVVERIKQDKDFTHLEKFYWFWDLEEVIQMNEVLLWNDLRSINNKK